MADWRWYRDITAADGKDNAFAISCYERNLHNLIDKRYVFPERSREENREVYDLALRLWNETFIFNDDRSDERLGGISRLVELIGERLAPLREAEGGTAVCNGFADAAKGLRKLRSVCGRGECVDFGEFERMFGRSQQYLSFVRVEN
jgi:hypothetical protein